MAGLWETLPTSELLSIEQRLIERERAARERDDEGSRDYWLESIDRMELLLYERGFVIRHSA